MLCVVKSSAVRCWLCNLQVLQHADVSQAVAGHADDPQADKLLLVMEYAEAGPVMRGDRSTEKVPLAEGVALKFFRDVLQVKNCYCTTGKLSAFVGGHAIKYTAHM